MRIERLISAVEEAGIDAFIVARDPNIFYYAGTVSGGILLVAPGSEALLLAPGLNLAIAQAQASGVEVRPFSRNNLLGQIVERLKQAKPGAVGFDELSLNLYLKLRDGLQGAELKASSDVVWGMRRVKDPTEQRLMRRAGALADVGMEAVRESLGAGVREHEVAAEAAHAMMRNGAEGMAFEIIVASGPRSAYPHAGVTDRRIGDGDLVTVDLGAAYRGYMSDLTRTFIVGEPSEKQADIYRSVLRANESALPEIREGAKGNEVDGIARAIIAEEGYGDYFIHGLGHGVGLEVHEPPSLGEESGDTLQVGNVVTDEPGVYIPGFGGVRIEDTVLVSGSGPERLTRFDKDLDAARV